jgi:hypothetical protein
MYLKSQIDIVTVGDLNTPLQPMDMLSSQKNQQRNLRIGRHIRQMDLIDIYRVLHPTTTKCTFFLAAYVTFSKVKPILGHEAKQS